MSFAFALIVYVPFSTQEWLNSIYDNLYYKVFGAISRRYAAETGDMFGLNLMAKSLNTIFKNAESEIKQISIMAIAKANALGCDSERELFQDDKRWQYT